MPSTSKFIVAAVVVADFLRAAAAADLADQGRAVFKKHQHAVVTVQLVQKVTYSAGGRAGEPREARRDVTGTNIDPEGLVVLALSEVDPTEVARRMYSEYKVEVEVSDVKMLTEDGTEVPGEIVLRDKDLDLAFIRPKAKPASPLPAVDLTKSAAAQVLDPVVTINRLGRAAGRAYAASIEHVSAVVQKPRTFYIPDSRMTSTESGSPAFALDGSIVGIFVNRTMAVGTSGPASRSDVATSIILPAAEVLKAAKQAPEAKGEESKKEAAPEKPAEAEKK